MKLFSEKVHDIIVGQPRDDGIFVVGVTGPAGAGKTTLTGFFATQGEVLDTSVAILGLDSFFRRSSAARRLWLEEGKEIGEEEYGRRCDMLLWWDLDRAKQVITDVRDRKPVHLTSIYNRADRGELSGVLDIEQHNGGILVFEGVAVAHFKREGLLDYLIYVHADDEVRRERLHGRDQERHAGAAAEERWRITQDFEQRYFGEFRRLADVTVINNGGDAYVQD